MCHQPFFSGCVGVQIEDKSLLGVFTGTAERVIQCRGLRSNWKPLIVGSSSRGSVLGGRRPLYMLNLKLSSKWWGAACNRSRA